jgi:hypothetical protein
MKESYTKDSQTESNSDEEVISENFPKVTKSNFSCKICGQNFEARWEVMAHRKEAHRSTTRKCNFFVAGHCAFNELCWFRHGDTDQFQASPLPQTLTEYKCGLCGNIFKTKKEFMQHRKNQHISYVSECRENENGCCRLSGQDCWFKHSDKKSNNDDENSSVKNSEIIGRLFDMMEVFAQRMKMMEDQM